MVGLLNCAASAAWGVYAASGLVSVVFAASDLKNIGAVTCGAGNGKPSGVLVIVDICGAGVGVENNIISDSDRVAGAAAFSGILCEHSFFHGVVSLLLCGEYAPICGRGGRIESNIKRLAIGLRGGGGRWHGLQ
jgi:hypothetical protein